MFSQHVRDGAQNLLWVLNLIYGAHNGRGVGLPYYSPFMAKLHYNEFWVTSYNRGGWTTEAIFSQNFRDGEQNLSWVINLIYGAHNGRCSGFTILPSFSDKNCITLNFG